MNHNIHCNAENVEKGGQNPSLHQMADYYNLFSIRKRISPKRPVWMLQINQIISGINKMVLDLELQNTGLPTSNKAPK